MNATAFFRIILLVVLVFFLQLQLHAQQPSKQYKKKWKKVARLAKKHRPASAYEVTKEIYALARRDGNDVQLIRTILYVNGLQQNTREDNELASIKAIESELNNVNEPARSVLKSILAEVYLGYYEENKWKLNGSAIAVIDSTDIEKWTTHDIRNRIAALYLESLKEEKLLQQTPVDTFEPILLQGNTRALRPTLFDLLAHRALDYFSSPETNSIDPGYSYEISEPAAFDPSVDFIRYSFSKTDSVPIQYRALQLFQKLIAFHLNDNDPAALIDADIRRLEFARSKSVYHNKQSLFVNALERLTQQYPDHPAAAQAWYLIACDHESKAALYNPYGDTAYHYDNLTARAICEKVLEQKTGSEGRTNCYNLLNRLNREELKFEIEEVNIPGQPFRALVQYYNVPLIHLRLQQLNDTPDNAKPVTVKQWQQELPNSGDLQPHSVEIKIDELPAGKYQLTMGTGNNLDNEKTLIAYRSFHVSNISYVNYDNEYFILHRDNGTPLAGATLQIWNRSYNANTKKYERNDFGKYQADSNGHITIAPKDHAQWRYHYFEITYGSDHLVTDESYSYMGNSSDIHYKTQSAVYLFTDRGIYRPGQTVYFKGIVINSPAHNKRETIRSGHTTFIYLYNTNREIIDSLRVTTNEFGSFSGQFRLPSTGRTGTFTLFTNPEYVYIRVEEYKRPTFEVEYKKLTGAYKVNDSIRITGIAKAFAGNTIDGASVKYRIVRATSYPFNTRNIYASTRSSYASSNRRPFLYRSDDEVELAHGELKTEADGTFTVVFKAVPSAIADKRRSPQFRYTIYADVTDINGETRSAGETVTVTYQSFKISGTIPEKFPADSLHSISIITENMNREFVPSIVNVSFTKLKEENRLIRPRLWGRPDQFVMDKATFIRYFPNDEYKDESDFTQWEKGERVYQKTDSVKATGYWGLNKTLFTPGYYLVEVTTTDKDGWPITFSTYTELYKEQANVLNRPEYLWMQKGTAIDPGDTSHVKIGSAADNVYVIQTIDKDYSYPAYSTFKLDREKKSLPFTATENDRGGYGVSWVFVKHNRVYQDGQIIGVSWNNKDLAIEYASFRDKTQPGSRETWKMKISGYKKEKVAAEMLATMFDASLDKLYRHDWYEPGIWPYHSSERIWSRSFFTANTSNQGNKQTAPYRKVSKDYDMLLSSFIYIPGYKNSGVEPLWWLNPLDYIYSETRNPRLMRLPKPSLPDSDSDGVPDQSDKENTPPGCPVDNWGVRKDSDGDGIPDCEDTEMATPKDETVTVRKNFSETAFFFPSLHTDADGNIEFLFTLPESLTKWKFMAIAHTRDGSFGKSTKEIITQKELMVQPNHPRFLRQGDKITLVSKVVNLTDKEIIGEVKLQLIDPFTNSPVDALFKNADNNKQAFKVPAGQSVAISFPVDIPLLFDKPVACRIIAQSDKLSDGEEIVLPILSNRELVTESLPLPMKGNGSKSFVFEKLLQSGKSSSLQQHGVTVEFTSNPAWQAIQALPYLVEYPYECAEQTWNRYYGNAVGNLIVNSSPKIREAMEAWRNSADSIPGKLQNNDELKSLLLEETPWLLQGKSESAQKRNMALTWDKQRLEKELYRTWDKLQQLQTANGAFAWFNGGPDSWYITQYIITGIGKLKRIADVTGNSLSKEEEKQLMDVAGKALRYLDNRLMDEYTELRKEKELKDYSIEDEVIQYLYMRSFFTGIKLAEKTNAAYRFFYTRMKDEWKHQTAYLQGMIVLTLYRKAAHDGGTDEKLAKQILVSLKENSVYNEEAGRYWKSNHPYYWQEAPIEKQALLIEAFREIDGDKKTIDELRTWLLKNKQTHSWPTTKATADACYALLTDGSNWINNETAVEIRLGSRSLLSSENKQEAGTGYFKKVIRGEEVQPAMGNINVTVSNKESDSISSTWGAVYWQYFEDLDRITPASTPLKLSRQLFIEKNTNTGPVLYPVKDGDALTPGDKIKVRIELRSDRDMEFIHLKDMRASGLEPVNVLSQYKWQGGLGYYEMTKDAATHFFFDRLPRGTYVFEYPLYVTHVGQFSNGVATIQCMYAPEFSAHSEGVRLHVKPTPFVQSK